MIATAQTASPVLPSRNTRDSQLHTALLSAAAVIVSTFVLGIVLVASLMLVAPLPAPDGAAPVPQMLPQPSAEAGLDR